MKGSNRGVVQAKTYEFDFDLAGRMGRNVGQGRPELRVFPSTNDIEVGHDILLWECACSA
jgi:hypothetical protein